MRRKKIKKSLNDVVTFSVEKDVFI